MTHKNDEGNVRPNRVKISVKPIFCDSYLENLSTIILNICKKIFQIYIVCLIFFNLRSTIL